MIQFGAGMAAWFDLGHFQAAHGNLSTQETDKLAQLVLATNSRVGQIPTGTKAPHQLFPVHGNLLLSASCIHVQSKPTTPSGVGVAGV
jgi:hypothetical protein